MPLLRQKRSTEDAKRNFAIKPAEKMLYLHKLSDLNLKIADIESIEFVREIRARMNLPISSQNMYEYLSGCLVSEQDIEVMEQALAEVNPALEQINNLLLRKDSLHEPINILRTLQMLQKIPGPLANNVKYLKEILAMQAQLINESASLLNSIPTLKGAEEKAKANAALSSFFERILRNREFFFKHLDIIYEAHTSIMNAIEESMSKGYFFHVTLEEELRKADFAAIRLRIPAENLKEVEEIRQQLQRIKQGIDKAYEANMKMVTCAVLLYSTIKWATAKPYM